MQENLISGVRLNATRILDKARIVKTWQQYYEDLAYDLWGFSPSPTARILAQAIATRRTRRAVSRLERSGGSRHLCRPLPGSGLHARPLIHPLKPREEVGRVGGQRRPFRRLREQVELRSD